MENLTNCLVHALLLLLAACSSAVPNGEMPGEGRWADGVQLHRGRANAVLFSRDGSLLATAGEEGTVRLVKVSGKIPSRSIRTGGTITSMALSPDGKRIALGFRDGTVSLRTFPGLEPVETVSQSGGARVNALVFSADGGRIYTGCDNGCVYVWDFRDPRIRGIHHRADNSITGLAVVSFERKNAVLCSSLDGRVHVFIYNEKGESLMSYGIGLTGWRVCSIAAQSRRPLFACGREKEILTMKVHTEYRGSGYSEYEKKHDGFVTALAYDGTGTLLASGGLDGKIKIWDARRPYLETLIGEYNAKADVNSLAFSPDGRLIAAALADGRVILRPARGDSKR